MNIFDHTIKTVDETLGVLGVSATSGLTSAEVRARVRKYGQNLLRAKNVMWWHILLRQFKSAFVYLLVVAVMVTLLLGEYVDTLMILLFLFINAILGFYQEYRSEKTVELLKHYVVSSVKVVRDGKLAVIRSSDLVPGDVVFLETGNKIPADVRFLEIEHFSVDESVLTGESVNVEKNTDSLGEIAKAYYQANNLGFSGTAVVSGTAKAVVVATGNASSIGTIAKITDETRKVSNFEKGISNFANFIMKMVVLVLLIVFVANIGIKGANADIAELFLFSIALTVSVIPEALPVVTTFSLSRGARRLAKKGIIVKRLSAVEDLGGIQILCSDKTGTLTENELSIAGMHGRNHGDILRYANLAGDFGQKKKIEPFDRALEQGIDDKEKHLLEKYERLTHLPFDPKTRRNISLLANEKDRVLLVRGAPEAVLDLCASDTDKNEKKKILEWVSGEGRHGRRVLAVAKMIFNSEKTHDIDIELLLKTGATFTFVGVVSFEDTIKKSAFRVVKKAAVLGVRIKIITGDSKEVAASVASEIGVGTDQEDVITADEWEALPAKERDAALEKYSVFARVSPEQKYEIVKSMQEKHEVGFLGEGINDAPVLKAAGVAIVVNSASDIAREASDIILLKKNLETILDGIAEGRKVFANTTKYIQATLTSNFGNFFAVATASLLIDFLPMLPLQILLVNLLSDFPMIAVATDSVDDVELVSPRRYDVKSIVLFSVLFGLLSAIFAFIFFGLYYRLGPDILRTNWFIASILTELVLIFSVRTNAFFVRAKRPSVTLLALSLVAMGATILLPFTKLGAGFSFVRPLTGDLKLIFVLVVVYFALTETLKLVYYRKVRNESVVEAHRGSVKMASERVFIGKNV